VVDEIFNITSIPAIDLIENITLQEPIYGSERLTHPCAPPPVHIRSN
jgi:hypothetical protein